MRPIHYAKVHKTVYVTMYGRVFVYVKRPCGVNDFRESDLQGIDQVLHQEEAAQLVEGGVDPAQGYVAVFVDHLIGQRDVLLQIQPAQTNALCLKNTINKSIIYILIKYKNVNNYEKKKKYTHIHFL